jgi:hypothetical protein
MMVSYRFQEEVKSVGIILFIILVIGLVCYSFVLNCERQENEIHKRVAAIGGQVISADKPIFDHGPFWRRKGKHDDVWRFKYSDAQGNVKVGWVLFGTFGYEDWVMNPKE